MLSFPSVAQCTISVSKEKKASEYDLSKIGIQVECHSPSVMSLTGSRIVELRVADEILASKRSWVAISEQTDG